MNSLQELAERILAGRPAGSATVDLPPEPPFDPIAWRVERCRQVLARRLPRRFHTAETDRPEVLAWIDRFITDPADCPSMVFAGRIGSGKTHTAYATVRACALGRERRGGTIEWYATTHQQLAADTRPQPDGSHLDVVDRCERVDLLLIDDLAVGKITDWGADVLLRIIDRRWADCRPMLFTTNVPPGPLEDTVGPRIASRLRDTVRVGFVGEDLRGAR